MIFGNWKYFIITYNHSYLHKLKPLDSLISSLISFLKSKVILPLNGDVMQCAYVILVLDLVW